MINGGDAAEQLVKLELEGVQVAAKITGSAAKNVAALIMSIIKQQHKTKGAASLAAMWKTGKVQTVFDLPYKDLKNFAQEAKRYGVMYCVIKDPNTVYGDNTPVAIDIFKDDVEKVNRIVDNLKLITVDKAEIEPELQKAVEERKEKVQDKPEKDKNQIIMEEAVRDPAQKEQNAPSNPSAAKTEKDPPSRQPSETAKARTDEGVSKPASRKPSIKKGLDRIIAEVKEKKETERAEPQAEKPKSPANPQQTVHQQPKHKSKKQKER